MFGTEAEGEAYARTASPRLWALVVFHSGPNSAGSDVTIRQNYTALPSASQAINKHSHGVPRGNKRYFTSGFLVPFKLLSSHPPPHALLEEEDHMRCH